MACSLRVIRARDADIALVFRRGPSRMTRLVAWDLRSDRIDPGQWFKGIVYPERCDLSPDGRHLLAFLGTHRGPYGTWTVLSHPPFLTALCLWPLGGTYGGGGRFLDDARFVLHHGSAVPDPAPGFARPRRPGPTPVPSSASDTMRRAVDADWTTEASGLLTRASGRLRLERRIEPEAYAIRLDGDPLDLPGMTYADIDRRGDLLLAVGSRLLRLRADRLDRLRDARDLTARARVVADLGPMAFEPVEAPYPTPRPPEASTPFLPRLDRVTREDRRARRGLVPREGRP